MRLHLNKATRGATVRGFGERGVDEIKEQNRTLREHTPIVKRERAGVAEGDRRSKAGLFRGFRNCLGDSPGNSNSLRQLRRSSIVSYFCAKFCVCKKATQYAKLTKWIVNRVPRSTLSAPYR
jgi:hypothetical protein